jgi:hypothetical protein
VATAPTITSSASASVVENTTGTAYTASASDPQNDPITWDVFAGADAGSFTIDSNGALAFQEAPNFDLPGDANGDNIYEVTIRARAGGEQDTLALRLEVTNDKEGISVTRVVTGLVDPVGFAPIPNQGVLLIAERGGRVMRYDVANRQLSEDIFIRDNRAPGEVLAIAFGFPDDPWQEGIYMVTHDPATGLSVQAFDAERGQTARSDLGGSATPPPAVSMLRTLTMLIAVGSPDEASAQDASTPYGKLIELKRYNPYAGASLRTDLAITPEVIGDGIQRPGGMTPAADNIYLADQGSTTAHELTVFDRRWRPLDFGWPFWEGSRETRDNPPAQVNGPKLEYAVGQGRKEGEGIIAGLLNDANFLESVGDNYVFADRNGTIFTTPRARLQDEFLHFADVFEDRTLDFEPDAGAIDQPLAITSANDSASFFILDADGEIFRVEDE